MSHILVPLVVAVLKLLVPALAQQMQDEAQEGARRPELRRKLRERITRAGWLLLVVFVLTGCPSRTIYVPPGEPVRLRETVEGVKVWVLDENGEPAAGKMDLPEGWYCLPMEEESRE